MSQVRKRPQLVIQRRLFDAEPLHFDGVTFEPERDGERLTAQYFRVFALMRDGRWRSLEAIATQTGDPPASVSARLRDMRKERFGSHTVNRRYAGEGLYLYQLIVTAGLK